jgi:non-specific serine/threonine protein kinase
LVDKSLVRQEAGTGIEPRFAMLETVRAFGVEQLEASGEAREIGRRHARYFLGLAERLFPHAFAAVEAADLDRLETDHDNLRAALAWFDATGDGGAMLRLTGALLDLWLYRGPLSEGQRWMERALALASPAVAPAYRARVQGGSGGLALQRGDVALAVDRLAQAAAAWRECGHVRNEAAARSYLGGVLLGEGSYDRANEVFEETLPRFRALGDRVWEAHALFHLGAGAFARGDRRRAEPLLREAATLYDAAGDRLDAIDPLRYLGLLACRTGDHAAAAAILAENLVRLRERNSPAAYATGLADVATLAEARGQAALAARLFGAADALSSAEGAAFSLPARESYDRARSGARAALGNAGYEAESAAGRALPLEQALAAADQALSAPEPAGGAGGATGEPPATAYGLTARERDVLRLLAVGRTNPEIADALYVGTGTVRTHVSNILAKLGVANRRQAADVARRDGLT